MGDNINLTAGQKAILQRAIDAHNKTHKGDTTKQIDAQDIFRIAKNEKGVITVQIDAYGYAGSKDGKTNLNATADGQFDLELQIKDEEYNTNNDNAYKFNDMADSSENIKKFVDEYKTLEKTISQNNVKFNNTTDQRLTNLNAIIARFKGDDEKINAKNGDNPQLSPEELNEQINFLKEKLKEVKNKNNTNFLTQEENKALNTSTYRKKDIKTIRKKVTAQIEKAIDDLEAMKKDLETKKAGAEKQLKKLNQKMQELGINKTNRDELFDGKSAKDSLKKDYNANDFKKDLANKYKMPTPDKLKEVKFDTKNLPTAFQSNTSQTLTKAAAEEAITRFNTKQEDKTKKINLDDVAQITINTKTGDILIGMKDSQVKEGETTKHDGHYDYKIPSFYNPKSGVLNYNENLKLDNYGSASTKGIKILKDQLNNAIEIFNQANETEKPTKKKDIQKYVNDLVAAQVNKEDIRKILDDKNIDGIDVS